MSNKKMLATGTVALFLLAAIPSTYAFSGFGARRGIQKMNSENRDAVRTAIMVDDYNAFVTATGNSNITQEQFDKMIARYSEMETRRAERKTDQEAIQAAIAGGNYTTWASLISAQNPDAPILDTITADNFSKLQEMQKLRDKMRTLYEDFGMGGEGFGMMGEGQGGHGFGMMGEGRFGMMGEGQGGHGFGMMGFGGWHHGGYHDE